LHNNSPFLLINKNNFSYKKALSGFHYKPTLFVCFANYRQESAAQYLQKENSSCWITICSAIP